MAVITIYRIAEELQRLISGGNAPVASKVSLDELKIAIGQVANGLLKMDYINVNIPTREMIPNGAMLGLYENQPVVKWQNKSRVKLPITPLKLPRNIGVYSVFPPGDPDAEYIPLEMGQGALLNSQSLLSALLGIAYTPTGDGWLVFNKDLTLPNITTYVSMRLVVLDISLYGDYDILPLLPEMEWTIKKEVLAMYGIEPVADKIVDPGHAEQKGVPINQQMQS